MGRQKARKPIGVSISTSNSSQRSAPVAFIGVLLVLLTVVAGAYYYFSLPTEVAPKYDPIPAFKEWSRQRQITAAFDLKTMAPGNVGGVAQRNIMNGEILVRVPREAMISNLRVINEVFPEFKEWQDEQRVGLPLIVYLVREKNSPQSEIRPFLDVLPQDFPSHPLMWDERTLNLTHGTGVDVRVQVTTHRLHRQYHYLKENIYQSGMYPFPSFEWDDFLWAYLVVQTRSWSLEVEDDAHDIMLVPYADMLNHKPGGGQGALKNLTAFEISATESYSPGHEVFDSYGAKSNVDLLNGYGFVLEDHPEDFMEISTVLPAAKDGSQTVSRTFRLKKNTVPMNLLKYIRQSVLTGEEQAREDIAEKLKADHGISLKIERQVVYIAISVVRNATERIGVTIARAQKELDRTDLTPNERSVWILRKSQVQLLRNVKRVIAQHWERQLYSRQLFGGVEF